MAAYEKKVMTYTAAFFTQGGALPMYRSLTTQGIEYTYEQDPKTKEWILTWKQ